MLEWALPEVPTRYFRSGEGLQPASWLRPDGLAEQRDAVRELAWQRYHLNVWTGGGRPGSPCDQWDANAGEPELEGEGFKVIGIDAAVSSDARRSRSCAATPTTSTTYPSRIGHGASRVSPRGRDCAGPVRGAIRALDRAGRAPR